MARFITLGDIKTHLRIDGTGDDSLLSLYADAVCEHIEKVTGSDWGSTPVPIPYSVIAAALLLVGDLYEHREGQSTVALKDNKTVERLLMPFRTF